MTCSTIRSRVAHWRETVGDNFFLFVGAFPLQKGCTFCWMPPSVIRLPVVIVGGGRWRRKLRREAQQRRLSNVKLFTGMLNDEEMYILFQLCQGHCYSPRICALGRLALRYWKAHALQGR